MPLAISPHFTTDQFNLPLRFDDKAAVFSDRVRGWQLDIAESLASKPHAGFAILAIVASYFEMIAKYEDGYTGGDKSRKFFKSGAHKILEPHTEPPGAVIPGGLLNLLYEDVRCGMYHAGLTGPSVQISSSPGIPLISFDAVRLTLDPNQLVLVLQDHFSRYLARLFDPANMALRANFETCFDSAVAGKGLAE